jgi:hypothetical protein
MPTYLVVCRAGILPALLYCVCLEVHYKKVCEEKLMTTYSSRQGD